MRSQRIEAENALRLRDDKIREEEARKMEVVRELTEICVRHKIPTNNLVPFECSVLYAILDELTSDNKYLMLAIAGMQNRHNYEEGYDIARNALSKFTVDSGNYEDQLIFDCWHDICYNKEDVDGRYFRDCSWNYDALLSIARDEQLNKYLNNNNNELDVVQDALRVDGLISIWCN